LKRKEEKYPFWDKKSATIFQRRHVAARNKVGLKISLFFTSIFLSRQDEDGVLLSKKDIFIFGIRKVQLFSEDACCNKI